MVIDDALTAIERENERRKGFLPKNFARQELDKRRLGDVVDLWRQIRESLSLVRCEEGIRSIF